MHPHILIEAITPSVDGGRYAAKGVQGSPCTVTADIFRDGEAHIRAVIQYRAPKSTEIQEAPLTFLDNDRFMGEFLLAQNGLYEFTVAAWTDRFSTWRSDFGKKVAAERNVTLDIREGVVFLKQAAARAKGEALFLLEETIKRLEGAIAPADAVLLVDFAPLVSAMAELDPRDDLAVIEPWRRVFAERKLAYFGNWYEFFPRSETDDASTGATLRQAERRLARLAELGFNVVYIPPVHPIGVSNRKGKNDALTAEPGDPGCPWAIGNSDGGHTAIDPALGTIADFDHFVTTAASHGVEVALDFAIQCSPDHPWVQEHPAWFEHRPDGSIRYAENPPNEYQDVYRVNFDTEDRTGLYTELYRVVMFWISHGVTIFRVDNPHTKPVVFWAWLIGKVKESNPEAIFLAEAFTRPKMMKALAKVGFTQSYTYFTWRNEKRELEEYLTELTQTDMREYFIPNFFANTHDVLATILQKGGPPAFKLRLVLAATMSPSYGIYSGYELCENEALHDKEEYKDSEKFEIKPRDYEAPGNLNALVQKLNQIRAENPALQELANLRFLKNDSDHVVCFVKATKDRSNVIIVAVNLDPFAAHHANVVVTSEDIGLGASEGYPVTDLLTGSSYTWQETNYVRLDPTVQAAHIFRVEKAASPAVD